ncbi:hypothetical protein BSKO_13428 [Bryopsis sp. KO-2023]|nr:hypothetical protein BSKO_13428 [Bryopsis sp. KO-2023]
MNFTCRNTNFLCLCVALLLASTSKVFGQEVPAEPWDDGVAAAPAPSIIGVPIPIPRYRFEPYYGDLGTAMSYTYTVSLRRRSDLGYFCTGVLVGSKHVLTAAHCIDSSRTGGDSRPKVVVGSASSSQTSGPGIEVISTQNVFIHPNYKSTRSPDLAILELSSAANVDPVQLPTTTNFRPQHGEILESIGWGRTRNDSGFSEIAQVVRMEFVARGQCRRELRKPVTSSQICMGGEGGGSCPGDDGGPIVVPGEFLERDIFGDDVLVGIVGASHVCGGAFKPDVHTNIVPFIDWIKLTAGAKIEFSILAGPPKPPPEEDISGMGNAKSTAVDTNNAASVPSTSESESDSACPVPEKYRNPAIYNVYNQRIDNAQGGKTDPLAEMRGGVLDPRNNMPLAPNQRPCAGQRKPLSTDRVPSRIPKGGTETTWVYPSPQMFYNALKRKGKGDDVVEDDMESVVSAHNMLNDVTWSHVRDWERLHPECGQPKLLRFLGRPHDLSPLARMKGWLGSDPPFDRHDWYLDRCGEEVRYVIDFYFDESKAGSPDAFSVDARPALDSFTALQDRMKMSIYSTFAEYGWPCPITGESSMHTPKSS